jgi:hypothetical protein
MGKKEKLFPDGKINITFEKHRKYSTEVPDISVTIDENGGSNVTINTEKAYYALARQCLEDNPPKFNIENKPKLPEFILKNYYEEKDK